MLFVNQQPWKYKRSGQCFRPPISGVPLLSHYSLSLSLALCQ